MLRNTNTIHYSHYAFFIFLLLMGQNVSINAQINQDTLSFVHLKTGISQNTVTEIFEDSEGYLWIGTVNGLNKYDGTDFEVFEKSLDGKTGLTNGFIESIYEDSDKNLFIGTSKGLSFYDRKLGLVRPYAFEADAQEIQTLPINTISRIDQFLWLGAHNYGLYRYNMITGETEHMVFDTPERGKPGNNDIIEVFQLQKDRLFVVTEDSKYIINQELQVKEQFPAKQRTSCVVRIGPSKFMFGSQKGKLTGYDIIDNHLVAFDNVSISPGHAITALEPDAHGNLWAGSENYGLSVYSAKSATISNIRSSYQKPNSISGNSIRSLLKTSNGTIWIGYFRKGLSFYDPNYYKFEHIKTDPFNPQSLSNDLVNCFSEDQEGNIWIGTDGGGLNYWDRKQGLFKHYSLNNGKLNSDVVISIMPDDQNQLWVGSWGMGLAIIDLKTMNQKVWTRENSFLASNNIRNMLVDKKGRIWIAAFNGGLQVYYPKTKTHKNISIKSDDGKVVKTVARLYEDDKGTIWVGTLMGLFKLKENNNEWSFKQYSSLNKRHFLSNDFINTITQDDYGNLWVGTQAGLNRYIPARDTFEAITRADGLKNDAIKGIIQDEYGSLWLSTDGGIIKYDEHVSNFSNYGVHDGLQENEFNANSFYKTNQYEMLFGGNNGFNIFTSNQAKKNSDEPKVVISDFKIFNKSVRPNDSFEVLKKDISQVDSITLRYDQSVINFEFNALTFRNAENVDYAYFLEGFEDEWNYIGNKTTATYTNLNPGDYRLRLKSTNSDGAWNDREKSLLITITPPFWKTWWFRTVLILSIFICIIIAYKIRIRSIKRYQAILEQKIHQRTKELRSQKKKLSKAAKELSEKNEEIQRFTYAVSHDLKSPLSNIKGIAGLIPLEFGSEDNTEIENCLDLINVSCNIMDSLIADITEIAKLGKIENKKELLDTDEIMQLTSDLVRGRLNVGNVRLHIAEKLPNIYGDRNRIIQVFGNLVDNAIKYMGDQKHPKIVVEAFEFGDSVKFTVTDNGSGMDENSLEKLFSPFKRFHRDVKGTGLGLYMTKQIVESHDGKITAESPGKGLGTRFSVIFLKAEISMKNEQEIQNLLEPVKV